MMCVVFDKLGKVMCINDVVGCYIEFCKGIFFLELLLIDFKIVVDCVYGVMYYIVFNVLRELGVMVIEFGIVLNGLNINDGVGVILMDVIVEKVKEIGVDFGFVLDGDGDCIMMVDYFGNVFDGD